jgi:serine/threonine protein kinase
MDSFCKQDTLPNLTLGEQKEIPSYIGPYKIDSLFNKGGMSILYLAIHPKTKKLLIIKVLSPKFIKNKEIVDRFLKEAKIITLTNHPNIIKLYGQGKWEQGLYIAMEFVQGISLRQFIQQRSFSLKKALEIITQVAYALCHLHSHKIIHRDLKPENILITESGEIKVIDFGIAQLKDDPKIPINKKKIIGTPTYMSPEQKENPENVSYTTDIFSLGIITYELTLGKISKGVIQKELLPKGLRPIIEKALKENPSNRYQSIVNFITDISEYQKEKSLKNEDRDDILKALDNFEKNLFPTSAPIWPQIEIGFKKKKGKLLSGIYLDFFKLFENLFIIVLAESVEPGMDSINHLSILKGMVKATIFNLFSSENQDLHLTTFLSNLNQIVFKDPMKNSFAMSVLMLIPENQKFVFASAGSETLFNIPNKKRKVNSLLTPNPLLGVKENLNFVETAGNWFIGDKLMLFSPSLKKKTSLLEELILSTLIFPTKIQSEKIISGLKSEERAMVVLNLERAF